MEAGRGRRAAVALYAVLVILTTFTTAGCDLGRLGGEDLEAAKSLPDLGGVADAFLHRSLSMDVEEDEDFDLGLPVE